MICGLVGLDDLRHLAQRHHAQLAVGSALAGRDIQIAEVRGEPAGRPSATVRSLRSSARRVRASRLTVWPASSGRTVAPTCCTEIPRSAAASLLSRIESAGLAAFSDVSMSAIPGTLATFSANSLISCLSVSGSGPSRLTQIGRS